MNKKAFVKLILCMVFTGCVPQPQEPPMTQLQVRAMQTREYATQDIKLVLKSVMNVLQDEGFIIKNAVSDLGLLTAEKYIDIERHSSAAFAAFSNERYPRFEKQLIYEASANVSEYGNSVRVRLNFQVKTIDNYGNPMGVQTILDPELYQSFFERVSKGVFIQQSDI